MKKRGYFLGLILATMMLLPTKAMAECSYEDQVRLSSEAANVKVSYEIVEETSEEELKQYGGPIRDYVRITIMNLTENLKIYMKDNWGRCGEDCLHAGIEETVDYGMTEEGIYERDIHDTGARALTFTVYSSNASCEEKAERTGSLNIPGFNRYSLLEECAGSKEYYCQKYPTVEVNLDKQQILNQLEKSKEEEKKTEEENQDFWKQYGNIILICIGVAGLGLGVAIVIRIIMKKRSKVK